MRGAVHSAVGLDASAVFQDQKDRYYRCDGRDIGSIREDVHRFSKIFRAILGSDKRKN